MSSDHGSRLRDQLLLAEFERLADEFRKPGYMSSNMSFVDRLDPLIVRLRASDTAPLDELNAREALFAFMGWLTCFERPVTFSRCHDASLAVELITIYAAHQGLADVRDGWDRLIVPKAPEPVATSPREN